jgi:hypothetical protein
LIGFVTRMNPREIKYYKTLKNSQKMIERTPAHNTGFASGDILSLPKCGVTCINSSAMHLLGFSGRLTVRCSETHHCAKSHNVSGIIKFG